MSTPFAFDSSDTERSRADTMLASLGITQTSKAASAKAARGDASVGLVGIGSAGSPSQNPLGVGPVSGPIFLQPNPAPAPTTTAPPGHFNAMGVTARSRITSSRRIRHDLAAQAQRQRETQWAFEE